MENKDAEVFVDELRELGARYLDELRQLVFRHEYCEAIVFLLRGEATHLAMELRGDANDLAGFLSKLKRIGDERAEAAR
jgi:hypothetical protein